MRIHPMKNILIAAAFLAALAPLSARAQADISLTGTVTDANGNKLKNAKVTLLGRKVTVLTDANGAYSFAGAPSSLGAVEVSDLEPKWMGDNLRFAVRGEAKRVRIALYSLSGLKVRDVMDARLPDGAYQARPFTEGMARGAYVLRFQSEGAAKALRVANLGGVAGVLPQADARPAGALRKSAAGTVDTLSVVAMGFDRAERNVDALSGTQDFKLTAIKLTNIQYKTGNISAAEKAACILDVHQPKTGSKWPVVIHLHGGGMTGGDRNEAFGSQYAYFGNKFLDAGYMEVSPGYRLIGQGTWPDYINDAAAAAVWVRKNIEPYGGDPNSVFVTGFSAGAYLTHMLVLDSTYFAAQGYDAHFFAGFVSMSGQTKQHANIAADLKVTDIMKQKPYAMPMGHIHKTDVPWQVFVGGAEGQTITDNQDMYNALIAAGSTKLTFDVIPNQPHTCADLADANSPKRDKFFAFIEKYRAK